MTSNTMGMIHDQINEGTLPPNMELEAFNAELNEILRPLKERANFEELASIYYDMAACAQQYDFTCGFKQGIGMMVECMMRFREEG